jgi:NADH:ubiquinone oxidoreductase subunit 6 (subunit J)
MLSCKTWERLIAVLLLYPLTATTVALDALWIAAYGRYWPPVIYTVAVLVIAGAISVGRQRLLSLPPAACLAVGAVAVGLANVAMAVAAGAAGEVSSARRYAGGAAAVALAINGLTLAITALACRLGERVIESQEALQAHDPQTAEPRPTLVDSVLVALPTIAMQPVEQATLVDLDRLQAA